MSHSCRVFIATSLDGFIARTDGTIDWLDRANLLLPPGEDCGYAAFMDSVDALAMGRATFETVSRTSPWPYGSLPVYVLSHTLTSLPPGIPPSVRLVRGGPDAILSLAKSEGHRSLYVDGGRTIQAFLSAGLITDIIITVIPVLLGTGRPLFGPLPNDVGLTLVSSRGFSFGFVQSHYAVARDT